MPAESPITHKKNWEVGPRSKRPPLPISIVWHSSENLVN